MAAHPFGPIENQLIVGYYKRGFSPAKVKPVVTFDQIHQVLDPEKHPEHYLLKPVFYGWSPANGNSSSHDFRVSWEHKPLRIGGLLSRGLGYRITFTMPEQEIRTEDPTSLPKGELEILDLTGKQISSPLKLNLEEYFREADQRFHSRWKTHLSRLRVLRFEQTLLCFKIVENETDEYLFPVYSPPGSSIDERHLAAAERHKFWLGECYSNRMSLVKVFERVCSDHILELFTYLEKYHTVIPTAQKLILRRSVQASASGIVRCLTQTNESLDFIPPSIHRLLPRLVNNLESDIRKWLDDEGPFPRYFSVAAIAICFQTIFSAGGSTPYGNVVDESQKKTEPIFDALALFEPNELLTLLESVTELGIREAIPDQSSSILGSPQVILQTKNFTILPLSRRPVVFKGSKSPNALAFAYDSGVRPSEQFNPEWCLLEEDDTLLAYSVSLGEDLDIWDSSYKVTFTRQHLSTKSQASGQIDLPDQNVTEVASLTVREPRIFLSNGRIAVCDLVIVLKNRGKFNLQRLSFLDLSAAVGDLNPCWSDLNLAPDQVSPDSLQGDDFTVHTGHPKQQVYIMAHSMNPDPCSRDIWICLASINPTTSNFEIASQASFQIDTLEEVPSISWSETKQHQVVACAFTPDCRLWAFMYWRGRFVSVGRKNGGRIPRPVDFRGSLIQFGSIYDFKGQNRIFAYKQANESVDTSGKFIFGRIQFTEPHS